MNSDTAAMVRDAVNGCPAVVDPEASIIEERSPTPREFGDEKLTGDRMKPKRSAFRPAYIERVGTVGDGEGTTRPVHAVILEPLWYERMEVVSVAPEIVYEAAKYDCRVRLYPSDHRHGPAIWFVKPLPVDLTNSDGDRCSECQSTYFKVRDGVPECARCGTPTEEATTQTTLTEAP